MSDALNRLAAVIEARKTASARDSYVAGLLDRGMNAILKKVGEEAAETIIAAKDDDDAQLVHETADLWFHTLVMLAARGWGLRTCWPNWSAGLAVSGLEEKAARNK